MINHNDNYYKSSDIITEQASQPLKDTKKQDNHLCSGFNEGDVQSCLRTTFILTYASQSRFLPLPRTATHRDVAAPPAVISCHTAVDHHTSVMPHHLRIGKDGNWATFSCNTIAFNDSLN